MVVESPLQRLQEQAEAEFLPYGPSSDRPRKEPGAVSSSETDAAPRGYSDPVRIVSTYGEVEAEYASIRKSAGLIDLPHHGTIAVHGNDSVDFLSRMVTNDTTPLARKRAVRAFLLNRQGRIQADLAIIPKADNEVLLELDVFAIGPTIDMLEQYVFTEDVRFEDQTNSMHWIGVHGPKSMAFLSRIATVGESDSFTDLPSMGVVSAQINGATVTVMRRDSAGEIGLEILCPADRALEVHEKILEIGLGDGMRSIGWMAYNMARMEAGTPLFLVDYGTDTLPHETGPVLESAVSFTKGCYPGQEVVARMQSRGRPRQILRGIRLRGEDIPVTGCIVLDADGSNAHEAIGAVTSAAPSPMLGNVGIAYAMIKSEKATSRHKVAIGLNTDRIEGEIHDLTFWSRK